MSGWDASCGKGEPQPPSCYLNCLYEIWQSNGPRNTDENGNDWKKLPIADLIKWSTVHWANIVNNLKNACVFCKRISKEKQLTLNYSWGHGGHKFTIYWCNLNRETLRQDGEQRTIYFDHPIRRSEHLTRRSTLWTLPDLRTLWHMHDSTDNRTIST